MLHKTTKNKKRIQKAVQSHNWRSDRNKWTSQKEQPRYFRTKSKNNNDGNWRIHRKFAGKWIQEGGIMYKRHILGTKGEDIAVKYLEKIGCQILIRNFRSYYGEIDIIVKDKNEYVFVEVKTRASDKFGKPVEAVDNTKQKHIYKTAEYYLYCKKLENTYIRFDIIEVYKRQEKFYVHHIKNALMF